MAALNASDLQNLNATINARVQELGTELRSQISNASTEHQGAIAQLRSDADVSVRALEKADTDINNMLKKFESNLDEHMREANTRFMNFDAAQNDKWTKLDADMATIHMKLATITDPSQQIGSISDELHSVGQSILGINKSVQESKVDMENFKASISQQNQSFQNHLQTEMASTRNSLSTAIAMTAQPGGGSGSRPSDTLDADKRLQGIVAITGDESYSVLVEWYTKAYIKLESVVPGSRRIFDWVIAASDEITPGKIDNDRLEDRITAHRLNRELVSWMTGVVGGTAWTHAKHVDPMQGLEAWRQVAQNLLRQGPSQLADEFKFLLNPPPMNKRDTIHLWIKAWETRADKLAASSSAYAFNAEFRNEILYKSLPKDVKDIVDGERNKGELRAYPALREWLMNLGNNAALSLASGPQHKLLLNALDEGRSSDLQPVTQQSPQQPGYSSDEWVVYMCTPEGAEFAQENHRMPEVAEALLAMNSAGKGGKFGGGRKGGTKGAAPQWMSQGYQKGQGFQGKCWNCDEVGHTARECTKEPRGGKAKGKGKKGDGKGKGEYGKGGKGKSNMNNVSEGWALCMTEDPPQRILDYLNQIDNAQKVEKWENVEKGAKAKQVSWKQATEKANRYDLLVVDQQDDQEDTEVSMQVYPPLEVIKTMLARPHIKKRAQGPSKVDRELSKMVKEIEAAGIRTKMSAATRVNLDELDANQDSDELSGESRELHAQVKSNSDRQSDAQVSKSDMFTNAQCVMDCINLMEDQRKLEIQEVLSADMCHTELLEANEARGNCVDFGQSKLNPDSGHDFEQFADKHFHENNGIDMKHMDGFLSASECDICSADQQSDSPQSMCEKDHPRQSILGKEMSELLSRELRSQILVITEQPPELNNLKGSRTRWVKIATVLDSGACKHVAPRGIFSLDVSPTTKSKEGHAYYGPSGDPIPNMGEQKIKAQSEHGLPMNIDFDIAKITRPLMSVSEMVKKHYRVVFDDDGSYIENKRTGEWVDVRQEGSLYYLDLWVEVPEELASSPFVRQVAPQ